MASQIPTAPKPITEEKIWWNLTKAMTPYLDNHQIYRLLDFQLEHVQPMIFDSENIKKNQLECLKQLDMVDMTWELERDLRNLPDTTDMPKIYVEKSQNVYLNLEQLEADFESIREKVNNEEVKDQLSNQRDNKMQWAIFKKDFGFVDKDLDTIFEHAKQQYDIGEYEAASAALYIYQLLAPYEHSRYSAAVWGRLAAEVLKAKEGDASEWTEAQNELNHLKESIDKSTASMDPLTLLQWRAWLLHWSLFIFFNSTTKLPPKQGGCKKTPQIIELFLNTEEYKNAIETICPWLLRYLAVAIVTAKSIERKQSKINMLIRLIQQETYNYSDPITDFLLCLNHHYDFEAAQKKLQQSADVLRSDFFLSEYVDDFIEHGRVLMFEMFCKIHQKIRIETIAEKLNMTQEDAELWIVELIRNARLDAKIDSESGTIVMDNDPTVPYRQILTRTHDLAMRSSVLINSLEVKIKGKQSAIGVVPQWAKQTSAQKPSPARAKNY